MAADVTTTVTVWSYWIKHTIVHVLKMNHGTSPVKVLKEVNQKLNGISVAAEEVRLLR